MARWEFKPRDSDNAGRLLPSTVQCVERFLAELGIWYRISENFRKLPAKTCRDAAQKRVRLGHLGIPLRDELKSFLGIFVDSDGVRRHFLAHCRGDRRFDFEKLRGELNSVFPVERLGGHGVNRLGLGVGLINPFVPFCAPGAKKADFKIQVFDREILEPVGLPDTMMTNSGSQQWGVEFRPRDLVSRLVDVYCADIATEDPREPFRAWGVQDPRQIAIITGNAPESGMFLWERLNRHIRALLGRQCRGDIDMPPVVVRSLPELGLTMELDDRSESVWPTLARAVQEVCAQGARYLSIACHTSHYFSPCICEICEEYGTEFVSMPDVLQGWLRTNKVQKVALVGIKYVSQLGKWSAYRTALEGIAVENLDSKTVDGIHKLAYLVKSKGANEAGLNRLRDVVGSAESEYIILALTELSLLLALQRKPPRSGKILLDPLDLCAESLALRYIGLDHME